MRSLPESIFLKKKKKNFPKSGNWGCTVLTDEDPLENWACSQRWQESAFGPRLFVNASCRNPNPKSVCFSSVWRLWVFFSPLHLIMSHKPGYGPQVAVAWMALLNLSSSICFLREKMITDAAPSPPCLIVPAQVQTHCQHQSNSISCIQSDLLGGLCVWQQAVLSRKGNSQMGSYCSKSWPLSHLGGEQLPPLASVPGPS